MISIYDWFGYELPLKERYRAIRRAGFHGVLIFWSNEFGRDACGTDNFREAAVFAREAGLILENIHAPVQHQNDLWRDNLAGQSLLDCYLQCIKDCASFEIPTMVLHLPDDTCLPDATAAKRIQALAEQAERLNVNVALENLRNTENLAFALEQTDSPKIGFCYDSCHHQNYAPETDLLARYGSRLMALHLHDNGGERNQHRLPFDGSLDWPGVMEQIAETGYAGSTALEPMNWEYTHLAADEFLRLAAERALRLEALQNKSGSSLFSQGGTL